MQLQPVELWDAVKQHNKYQDTFPIPSSTETLSLQVGEQAKVACNDERFWVEVHTVIGVGEYIGRVDNDLFQRNLHYNDLIAFSHFNILDVGAKPISRTS